MTGMVDLTLRPLRVEDAGPMTTVLAEPSLYEFTGGEPPSTPELERRYTVQTRGHSADHSEEWINRIVLLDEEPIGYVQATITGSTAEIAWVIGRAWQGHGHATRAAMLLVHKLRDRGVTELIAHVHPDHEASRRIAGRLGLEPTGTVVDGELELRGPAGAHGKA